MIKTFRRNPFNRVLANKVSSYLIEFVHKVFHVLEACSWLLRSQEPCKEKNQAKDKNPKGSLEWRDWIKNISVLCFISVIVRGQELNLWLADDSIGINQLIVSEHICRHKHNVRCIVTKRVQTDSAFLTICGNYGVVEGVRNKSGDKYTDNWAPRMGFWFLNRKNLICYKIGIFQFKWFNIR